MAQIACMKGRHLTGRTGTVDVEFNGGRYSNVVRATVKSVLASR